MKLILFLCCLLPLSGFGQVVYTMENDLEMYLEGEKLNMPFAGGINAAQIQYLDVNRNGEEELVVWDINAGLVKVFETNAEGHQYLPELSYFFPNDISGFLILVDFDGDGKKDLFTGSPFGIKAYKNVSLSGQLLWEEAQPFLRLENGSNLTANSLDIPLIEDLDGDGDLDILTFNFATGDYLEYYQNTSVERKGERDIDGFASAQVRWGDFEFCGCGVITFGFTCGGQPINQADQSPNLRVKHAGGHSLLYRDFTGNGVKDLLIGQDQCQSLYFLENKGSNIQPLFDDFSQSLPGLGSLPQFPIFHAAYTLAGGDLLISSHSSESSNNFGIDFSQSMYRYAFDPSPSLITNSFLQEEMLDLGENARPFFEGNRINGELTITANRLKEERVIGQAFQFTLQEDEFRLTDPDYLNLSRFEFEELSYQSYETVNGDQYHVVAGDERINNVPVKKIMIASHDIPDNFQDINIPGFNLRGLDQVHFFNDGQEDYLLLARQTGELVLFSANLDGEIEILLLERDYLGLADNPVSRGLSVAVHSGLSPTLTAIDQRGILFLAENFILEGEEALKPVKVKFGNTQFPETRFGRNAWISFIPDAFGQSLDLILGSRAGGIEYLQQLPGEDVMGEDKLQAQIYPNPATEGKVTILVNRQSRVRMVDLHGKLLLEDQVIYANRENELSLSGLAFGLYILEIVDETQQQVFKKLLIHP